MIIEALEELVGVDPSIDDVEIYEPILSHIRRFGRFDALGYDLVPAAFDNHRPDPKIAYIGRREQRQHQFSERYRRKHGVPARHSKQTEPPAVVHAYRVKLDRSRIRIEHAPRVLIDRSRIKIELD
jgi:hypothetical protein